MSQIKKRISVLASAFICSAALMTVPAMAEYKGLPRTFIWNPGTTPMVDTAQYKKEGPYTIGFSNASLSDLWLVTFSQGVQYQIGQHKDLVKKFIMTDANSDATKQISDIQDLVNQGIDLLIVNPATADALNPILGRVMRQGIPVVTVGRRVDDSENFVSFVTASDAAMARGCATWMAEKLNGKGKIVLLPGLAGSSPAEARLAAAKEVFSQFPGIEILDTQYTGWSPANGKQIMSAMIQRFGKDIQGVWSDSGLQGSGSVEAFLNAGYKPGELPPHTGGDMNGMYKSALANKFPFCGSDYTPSMGIKGVDVAFDILKGASVPKQLDVNFQIVVSEGDETASIKGDVPLNDYVAMDKPDDFIMGHGMGPDYDPKTFKIDLPN